MRDSVRPSAQVLPVCGFPDRGALKRDVDDPLIGTTLPGGYVILELVGVGGMGRVYRAEQKALGRTVAVKIIHPHLLGDESASARFITEARAASRLNHPNSVGVIDFGKSGDQLYLVMEFLRGRDLARVAYEEGPLSVPAHRRRPRARCSPRSPKRTTSASSIAISSPRTSSSSRCAPAATS